MGEKSFEMRLPRTARKSSCPAWSRPLPRWCATAAKIGALDGEGPTPVLDTMFSREEPKTGTDGTLSWTVDIQNPATGEDFVLGLRKSPCRTATPAPIRCGSQATTRAPSTA